MENTAYNISLETEIQYLKGVGPKRGSVLKAIGINTVHDLIRNFPRKYIDRTNIKLINQLSIGEKTVIIGDVLSCSVKKLKRGRRSRFKSLIIEKDFEPENPKQLEELTEESCKWPIGHPDEKSFYFCGRSSLKDFSYCKLHLLYAYQPKNKKEDVSNKEEIPEFIEKKTQTA